MRDLDEKPYSADEKRVAKWLCDKVGIGGGDDPIGFVIISHKSLAAERNHLKDLLRRLRAKKDGGFCCNCWSYPCRPPLAGNDKIWDEVAEAIE